MERVIQDDSITHVYKEFEWGKVDQLTTEYLEKAVTECEDEQKRFFYVLTKPDDLLLSDSKPQNRVSLDTWKYRARQKAEAFSIQFGGEGFSSASHHTALLCLLGRLNNATRICKLGGDYEGFSLLLIPIPGYGNLQALYPCGMDDTLFTGIPIHNKVVEIKPWSTNDILEAVFVQIRKLVYP